MAIIKYRNQSGVTYAYETYSETDPVTNKKKTVRKYLGRIDPETGEIIDTGGRRGRPPKPKNGDPEPDYRAMYLDKCYALSKSEKALEKALEEIRLLKENQEQMKAFLLSVREQISSAIK